MSDAPVIVELVACAERQLGRLTLNVPKTLNSLTLPMVDTLQQQLDAWRDDPEIGAILIDGSGEKAFCAGGDVQALHRSATATPGGPCEEAEAFFAREYRMNYTLHTYPKPIICWGHGIVMGGGLGVMAGCSHRVVTEATRIAMPEITIALFPDVGGSWFLNHMPGKSGNSLPSPAPPSTPPTPSLPVSRTVLSPANTRTPCWSSCVAAPGVRIAAPITPACATSCVPSPSRVSAACLVAR